MSEETSDLTTSMAFASAHLQMAVEAANEAHEAVDSEIKSLREQLAATESALQIRNDELLAEVQRRKQVESDLGFLCEHLRRAAKRSLLQRLLAALSSEWLPPSAVQRLKAAIQRVYQ